MITPEVGMSVRFFEVREVCNSITRELGNSFRSLCALVSVGEVTSESESSKTERLPVLCEFS